MTNGPDLIDALNSNVIGDSNIANHVSASNGSIGSIGGAGKNAVNTHAVASNGFSGSLGGGFGGGLHGVPASNSVFSSGFGVNSIGSGGSSGAFSDLAEDIAAHHLGN